MINYVSPFTALLKKWKGKTVFKENYLLELDLGGMFCISFDTSKKGAFEETDPLDASHTGRKEFYCDLIPICFPKGMKKVVFKTGTNDTNWEEKELVDFRKEDLNDKTLHTFLVSGMTWPISKEEEDCGKNFHWLEVRHPCKLDENNIESMDVGGVGCSHFIPTVDNSPVVFYIDADNLKDVSGKLNPVKPGLKVPGELDSYLIPTILPNGTILWLAINRDPNDSAKNARNLAYWTEADADYIGFYGETVFVDKLGISILQVNEDQNIAKPIKRS